MPINIDITRLKNELAYQQKDMDEGIYVESMANIGTINGHYIQLKTVRSDVAESDGLELVKEICITEGTS